MKLDLYLRPLWQGTLPRRARWRGLVLPRPDDAAAPPPFAQRGVPLALDLSQIFAPAGVTQLLVAQVPAPPARELAGIHADALVGWAGVPNGPVRDAVTELLAGPDNRALVVALGRAYQLDVVPTRLGTALYDFAALGPANAIAVASQLVFEVEAPATARFADADVQYRYGDVAWTGVRCRVDAPAAEPAEPGKFGASPRFRVDVRQRAPAIYFALGALDGFDPDDDRYTGARIRLRRSIGAVPSSDATLPVIAEALHPKAVAWTQQATGVDLVGRPRAHGTAAFHAVDHVDPLELDGEQLHYQIDVVDVHNAVLAQARASVLRERYDLPPAPAELTARLAHDAAGPSALVVAMAWTPTARERRDRLAVEIWVEDRRLDECGFYGDDDLALEELLREAALGDYTPAPAGAPPPNAPPGALAPSERLQRFAAKNDVRGLRRIHVQPLGTLDVGAPPVAVVAPPTGDSLPEQLVLTVPRTALAEWLPPTDAVGRPCGTRLYARLCRTAWRGDHQPTAVASALVQAHHAAAPAPRTPIGVPPVVPSDIPVFQLERVAPATPPLACVSTDAIATVVDAAARRVEVHFTHAAPAPSTAPVGGYRVLVRDVVGPGDAVTPFEVAAELDVLSPLVAAYRPVDFSAAAAWAVIPDPPPAAPLVLAPASSPDVAKAAKAAFPALLATAIAAARAAGVRVRARAALVPADPKAPPADLQKLFRTATATAADAGSWRVRGLFVDAAVALGCTADLVLDEQPDLAHAIHTFAAQVAAQSLTGTVGANRLVLVSGHMAPPSGSTADAVPLASLRLALIPADYLADQIRAARSDAGQVVLLGALASVASARLRDTGTRPQRVALGDERRVRYDWTALAEPRDEWHHELELAIQRLDRYERIRPRLYAGATLPAVPTLADIATAEAAAPAAATGRPALRAAVTVPRVAAVTDTVVVAPVAVPAQDRILFRALEPPTRFAAAANAFARTRVGRVQVHYRPYQLLAPADLAHYIAIAHAAPWTPQLAGSTYAASAGDTAAGAAAAPPPFTDGFEIVEALYWYTHGITCYVGADGVLGAATTAEHRRRPRVLGLPDVATYAGATGAIQIPLARLGSHLDATERTWLAAPRHQLLLSAFTSKPADAVRVDALPDLDTGYELLFDAGAGGRRVLVSLARLALRVTGAALAVDLQPIATSWARPPVAAIQGAAITVTGGVLAPALATVAAQLPAQRCYLRLTRGALATAPIACEDAP